MAFWLAARRDGQDGDCIQRFDPRFWTIDFPRPSMASLVTTGPDSLRLDVELHHEDALVGLIWWSEDSYDHPLLAYRTDRDYSRTTVRFRWRSGGILPLDAVNGPTLTVEGRDESGAPRTWYVRLWNYAQGTPEDALVELPFSALSGGWDASDPVDPVAIERMFISLAPVGYAPGDPSLLPVRCDGWAELSEIACDGDRAMLEIGDVMVPPHDLGVATAYDDSYNLTPARILRNARGLGYRGDLIHYLGMSHFYRLAPDGSGTLRAGGPEELCAPAAHWHGDFFARCARDGYRPIASLSYELLAEHCPPAWQQRFEDGAPALTGWVPPSALLSPANDEAMNFLRRAAARFVALMSAAGLPVRFQIGEPWWWTLPAGRIALYDDAAAEALGSTSQPAFDIRGPLTETQKDLLDRAGSLLAASTTALADHVRSVAADAELLLLIFTPTVLDAAVPELRRANLPAGWAAPAFDRLQVEDYDWLTTGADGARRAAYRVIDERLSYPVEQQDYLAGFVLDGADAHDQWPLIDAAMEEARARGVSRRFVWALPQILRDGFTRLPPTTDDAMQAFDDVLYPLALGRDAGVSAEFSTSVAVTASGHEHRGSHWSDARLHFDVGPGVRSEQELGTLIAFFRARRGAARGFRLRDPFDFSSNGMTGAPTSQDQLLAVGDGATARFQLVKRYPGPDPQVRAITRPRQGTVSLSVGGSPVSGFALQAGGWVVCEVAPPDGAEVRAGFLFDVPVRFASDRIDVTAATFAAGEAPTVPLIEVREAS